MHFVGIHFVKMQDDSLNDMAWNSTIQTFIAQQEHKAWHSVPCAIIT